MISEMTTQRKILRQEEVMGIYGLSRNALISMMQDEGMPQPIKLSPRRKGWFIHELDEYFANRPRGIHPTKSSTSARGR